MFGFPASTRTQQPMYWVVSKMLPLRAEPRLPSAVRCVLLIVTGAKAWTPAKATPAGIALKSAPTAVIRMIRFMALPLELSISASPSARLRHVVGVVPDLEARAVARGIPFERDICVVSQRREQVPVFVARERAGSGRARAVRCNTAAPLR